MGISGPIWTGSFRPARSATDKFADEIRRKPLMHVQVLLAYLPVTRLDHISSESSKRRASQNLFHACMRHILDPLEKAGAGGVRMKSGDGLIRRCHPILAVYAGDHPEQCLVTCVK